MTIDQLITELHKRREALVRKGYPSAHVNIDIRATENGHEFYADISCGRHQHFKVIFPNPGETAADVLARIDAHILTIADRLPAEAYSAWFDMAQLAERAAS